MSCWEIAQAIADDRANAEQLDAKRTERPKRLADKAAAETPEPKSPLESAIYTVSEKTLREVFKSICASCPDAKHEAAKQLLVAETDVKKRKKNSSAAVPEPESKTPAETPKEKKQVPRYEFCDNCKDQFDVSTNTSTSCQYHPGM